VIALVAASFVRFFAKFCSDALEHSIKPKVICLCWSVHCTNCMSVAEKALVDLNVVLPYRRPEFYSSVNQSICVDNSTYETVLCKSVQAYVKACIFMLLSFFAYVIK